MPKPGYIANAQLSLSTFCLGVAHINSIYGEVHAEYVLLTLSDRQVGREVGQGRGGPVQGHNSNEIEHAADANGQGSVYDCRAAPFLNNIMLKSAFEREN